MSREYVETKNYVVKNVEILRDSKTVGTGFFVDDYHCITCHHVICYCDSIKIKHDVRYMMLNGLKIYQTLKKI